MGGGLENVASGDYATVPGGGQNLAGGAYSFAAGNQAKATNTSAFVWADRSSATAFYSTANHQFNTLDADGVTVAAIQGLFEELKEQRAKWQAASAQKDAHLAELAKRLAELERKIQTGGK